MRRLLYVVAALVLVVVLLFGLALALVDAEAVTQPLAARASEALGQPVELGAIDLDLFPMPAARVRDVRVGELAEVEEVRLRISLLALLAGRVALRALEIDAPRLQLEVDADGRPVLPVLPAAPGAPETATGGAEPGTGADADDGPLLAITRLEIARGAVEVGPWHAENVAIDGSLGLDRSARLRLQADFPGLGALREGAVELSGLGGDTLEWSASGELRDVDLGAAAERAAVDARVAGRAEGRFEASTQNGVIASGAVELRARDLDLSTAGLEVAGDVDASAALVDGWRVDLTGAALSDGATLRKPRGARLVAAGGVGLGLAPSGPATVELGADTVALDLALDRGRVGVGPGTVDLAPLADWWLVETHPTGGTVELADLAVALEPLAVTGGAELRDVVVPLQHGSVSVSGPLRGTGPKLRAEGLQVAVGGQTARIDAAYDLAAGTIDVKGGVEQAELDPLLQALLGRALATGILRAGVDVSGPPALESLAGTASFEVAPGRLRGVSLVREVFGELAAVPLLIAHLKGRDLSKYEEEEFKRLAGRARLAQGELLVDSLDLEYRHSRSNLKGTVALADGTLDLEGRVVLSREADAELAGSESRARERVIPIRVEGSLDDPKVRLSRDATRELITAYTTGGRLREKLEEELGTPGADAVQDLLEGILGGGRKK